MYSRKVTWTPGATGLPEQWAEVPPSFRDIQAYFRDRGLTPTVAQVKSMCSLAAQTALYWAPMQVKLNADWPIFVYNRREEPIMRGYMPGECVTRKNLGAAYLKLAHANRGDGWEYALHELYDMSVYWGQCVMGHDLPFGTRKALHGTLYRFEDEVALAAVEGETVRRFRANGDYLLPKEQWGICNEHVQTRCTVCRNLWDTRRPTPGLIQKWGWARCPACGGKGTLADLRPVNKTKPMLRALLKVHSRRERKPWEA